MLAVYWVLPIETYRWSDMTDLKSGRLTGVGEQAYQTLRDMVINFELPPGAPLAETELSERLGLSRTPVREALGRLAREGLVRQYPRRGAFVSEISVPDIVELFQMREALESHAARLAAEADGREVVSELLAELRATREPLARGEADSYYSLMRRVDEAIVELADNNRLGIALGEIWVQISRARRIASKSPRRLLDTVDEHISLLVAIREGDAERAAVEARMHVRRSLANITASLGSGATPFVAK
jgi:GntR family transcriptional regulator, rspAB operon transcriptional repressor